MIIDNITDQNTVLTGCGCCGMPVCPRAQMDIEIRSHTIYFDTPYPTSAEDALAELFAFDWDSLDWERIYSSGPFELPFGISSGFGGAFVEWLPGLPSSAGVGSAYGMQFRYRRRVPFSHAGSYFKFAWIESALVYNCTPVQLVPGFWTEQYGDPSCYDDPVITPKEYTWSGPGTVNDPIDPEDPTWVSDWSDPVYLPSGSAGVINLTTDAWSCYQASHHGVKPDGSDGIEIYNPLF